MDKSKLIFNSEIKKALEKNKPIVALESTLISHGLPYPENINTAKASMDIIKKNGSIPATIAIINGKIKIGLSNKDLEILSKGHYIEKVSKNNLSIAINNNLNAATTVASTIYIASKIGIKFFATGGIGGVHLNADDTFDISTDLYELSKTNINVVCSGAKSILDINKTFEKLESLGIPRIGYKTDYMPGFWYHQTNKKVDYNFKSIEKLLKYLKTSEEINQNVSTLIFNTINKGKTISKIKMDKWINNSIKKAVKKSVKGKELTPYLIKEINKLSKNKTLKTNIDLIINNASLASKLASRY